MGITTANRDRNADLTAAYRHISTHPGCDIMDVAGALGSGARYAREVVGLLDTVDLVAPTQDDANLFRVVNDTEDVVAWVEARTPNAPKSAIKPQGSNPDCRCGCKASVNHPESTYRPGHDARHAGQVARAIVAGKVSVKAGLDQLPSDALKVKARDLVVRWQGKAEGKGKARKAAKAERTFVPGSVKVGRWTYPARQWSDGTTDRNTKRDGSGEWVAV